MIAFSVVFQHWDSTGSWNHFSWNTRTCLFNYMVVDILATQRTRASAAIIWPSYPGGISGSRLIHWDLHKMAAILQMILGVFFREINGLYHGWTELGLGHGYHDHVIKWRHFPRYWPFVRGIHRSPVNSPHKGQWRGALMFSLICVWMNGWVNTMVRLVIWDAIAPIMTSSQCLKNSSYLNAAKWRIYASVN